MKSIGQLFVGLLSAAGSSLLVLAAVTLSIVEGQVQVLPLPVTSTLPPQPQETDAVLPTQANTPTRAAPTPTPSCDLPAGWRVYTIQSGDTLAGLAEKYGIEKEDLYKKNCLENDTLLPGYKLYIPPAVGTSSVTPTLATTQTLNPTLTATLTSTLTSEPQCGPPPGWTTYVVRTGDNLYRIGLAYGGVTAQHLMWANCLSGETIRVGQRIYVPNVVPRFPTRTPTPTEEPEPPKPTALPTAQPTAEVPTEQPTVQPTEQPTEQPTVQPTDMPAEASPEPSSIP